MQDQKLITSGNGTSTDATVTTIPTVVSTKSTFPYGPENIQSWIIKHKSGASVRYVMLDHQATYPKSSAFNGPTPSSTVYGHQSYSAYCSHSPEPTFDPIFEGKNEKGEDIRLFIADVQGCKKNWKKFDYLLDCGDILSSYDIAPTRILTGDPVLSAKLGKYSTAGAEHCRVLRIDWLDRKAPELDVEFWPTLAANIKGNVLCACQGGHGRSGTSLVCLMMCLSDYTGLEAITHLRACHCPRAIESVFQHDYIDELSVFLGRDGGSHAGVGAITSYREEFLKSTNPFSASAQAILKASKPKDVK